MLMMIRNIHLMALCLALSISLIGGTAILTQGFPSQEEQIRLHHQTGMQIAPEAVNAPDAEIISV